MQIRINLLFNFFFAVYLTSYAVASSEDKEDLPAKTLVKAIAVPKASEFGSWIGKGLGFHVTEWVIRRANALNQDSIIRRIRSSAFSGNILDKYAPTGRMIGSYVGSIIAGCTTMLLIDRYYSPWKRFLVSLALGEFDFNRLKTGDTRKLIESIFLGIGTGSCVYVDLRKK